MKKLIKLNTDKLFTDITDQVLKFAKDWGKSGIVNVSIVKQNLLPGIENIIVALVVEFFVTNV